MSSFIVATILIPISNWYQVTYGLFKSIENDQKSGRSKTTDNNIKKVSQILERDSNFGREIEKVKRVDPYGFARLFE